MCLVTHKRLSPCYMLLLHAQIFTADANNLLLLFFLFSYSLKSLNAQAERLSTSPLLATRLLLPHTIVVRFNVRKINVVILRPKTAGIVSVRAEAYPYRLDFSSRMKPWMLPYPYHRGLTTMQTLLTCFLNWE